MRILLIEDDAKVASFIAKGLRQSSYVVETACWGEEGLELALAYRFDAIIVDVTLAGMDGISVVRELRGRGDNTPILALTCRSEIAERIAGLDAGCDDYMTKPFAFDELLARLRALTRRGTAQPSTIMTYGGITFDPVRRLVTRDGKLIYLSNREFALLHLLMREPGRVFTKSVIMERVWGADLDLHSNVLEVYVKFLRMKIDRGFSTRLLHTVRGIGYTLREERT